MAEDNDQLVGYIEGRLSFGLLRRLDSQIINGNGTAPNMRGILNTTGLGAYTAGTATEKALISIRKAKTVGQLSELDPDAVAINPVDFEAIELTTNTNGDFVVSPNVQLAMQPSIWGLNVAVTTAITGTTFGTTGGTFLVGAFREGCHALGAHRGGGCSSATRHVTKLDQQHPDALGGGAGGADRDSAPRPSSRERSEPAAPELEPGVEGGAGRRSARSAAAGSGHPSTSTSATASAGLITRIPISERSSAARQSILSSLVTKASLPAMWCAVRW